MKNLLILLVCFAFAGVTANAQSDAIDADLQGTYVRGTSSIVVTATGISDATDSGTQESSGTVSEGSAIEGSGSDAAGSGSTAENGLTDVQRNRQGDWMGKYTRNGVTMNVLISFDKASHTVSLTDKRSGALVATYVRRP